MATKALRTGKAQTATEIKYIIIGREIVNTEQRADNTVREALMKCFGFTPVQLDLVGKGIAEQYEKAMENLVEQAETDFITSDYKMKRQAIYNRQSEKKAVLECFRVASSMEGKELDLFTESLNNCRSLNALVAFCRGVVNTGEVGDPAKVVDKATSITEKRLANYVKRVHATTDIAVLMSLRTEIDKQIALIQARTPRAEVVNLSAKRKERKAQGAKAEAAVRAVNKVKRAYHRKQA